MCSHKRSQKNLETMKLKKVWNAHAWTKKLVSVMSVYRYQSTACLLSQPQKHVNVYPTAALKNDTS